MSSKSCDTKQALTWSHTINVHIQTPSDSKANRLHIRDLICWHLQQLQLNLVTCLHGVSLPGACPEPERVGVAEFGVVVAMCSNEHHLSSTTATISIPNVSKTIWDVNEYHECLWPHGVSTAELCSARLAESCFDISHCWLTHRGFPHPPPFFDHRWATESLFI